MIVPKIRHSIDLFCGAGGLSLGLSRAGFEPVFALDADPSACRSYAANINDKVSQGILEEFPASRILDALPKNVSTIDVVCGGPPCQGFSVQGRGCQEDPRNQLAPLFVTVAVELNPTFILMENVPTLLGRRGRGQMERIASVLASGGYTWEARIINAAGFGVPQKRMRAFIIAWAKSRVSHFIFPDPLFEAKSYLTVGDAIGDLPEPPTDFTEHPRFPNHTKTRISGANLERISHVPEGGDRRDIPLPLQLPCHKANNGHRHLDVYGRMSRSQQAPTITAMFDNFTRGRFAHPTQDRAITGREGARLQTFPDSFRFYGGKKDVARQIGNAVPPLLAEHLGRAIQEALEGTLTMPSETQLAFDSVVVASANWRKPSRRDRITESLEARISHRV
jgi:DNA (cytosine-5)-methyltransferase 1